jgi:hypothetical protein
MIMGSTMVAFAEGLALAEKVSARQRETLRSAQVTHVGLATPWNDFLQDPGTYPA